MKSDESILVKVIEVGTSEVKYKIKTIKILLFLSMLLVSFISNSQEQKYKLKKIINITYVKEYIYNTPEVNYYNSISLGVSRYGNVYFEMRRKQKEDGFGIDIYQDKVIYPDDFWNKSFSETDKFILNTNKRFGIGMYYINPIKYGFNVSIGLGFLHYYLSPSLINVSHNVAVRPYTSFYWIFGLTKEIRITEQFHLQLKGTFRNLERYSLIQENSHVTNFEPSLGIRYDMNFKK
jgi:hypothetical protein